MLVLLNIFVSASALQAASFTVDTLADNESNGCLIGQCTLREAVNSANLSGGADIINFANGLTGTITLTGGQLTITDDLTINGPGARNLSVSGNQASRVFLIATPLLGGNFTVNISGLTVTGGNASPVLIGSTLIGDGGGILNGALLGVVSGTSTLNLSDSVVSGNATTTLGGGIATRLGAVTNVRRSLIANNTANPVVPIADGSAGGGGVSNAALATTTIVNSTITNNSSLAVGGGLLNALGTVNLTNDTISHNTSVLAGGGVVSLLGTIPPILGVTNLRNTIIAKNNDLLATNVLGRDVVGELGSFNSLGGNLIGSNFGAAANLAASVFVGLSPQPNAQADLVGGIELGNRIIDPRLAALADNGGPTNTRALVAGSPAINAGRSCVTNGSCVDNPGGANPPEILETDQRGVGFPRLLESAVDSGAYESQIPPAATIFTVTTTADNEADGCGTGQCTLREAIDEANILPGAETINFAPGVTGTIVLTGGQLAITGDLTINGPGARNLSIDGHGASRVILVATPFTGGDFTVNLNGLTITGGNASPALIGSTLIGDGGGILNGALLGVLNGTSTLNLTDSSVVNNATTTLGGGVATRLGAQTFINRSLIAGNTANPVIPVADGTVGGGGLSNAALSTTTVINSTVTDNASLAAGGGILNAAGIVNLTNDTVSHNTSALAGGGVVSLLGTIPPVLGVTYLRNTIVARNNDLLATNILGRDVVGVLGSLSSLGNNLIGSNFGAEVNFAASAFVGATPQPNANLDLVGGIDAGNQIIDPLLGPLANNGGPTNTRAITIQSPAFNHASNCVYTNTCVNNPGGNPPFALTTDQRGAGFIRQSSSFVDIGAYELQFGVTAAAVTISGRVTAGKQGLSSARVELTGSDGATRAVMTNAFGNFTINDVSAGPTYIVRVAAKKYTFAPQIVSVTDNVSGLTFQSY